MYDLIREFQAQRIKCAQIYQMTMPGSARPMNEDSQYLLVLTTCPGSITAKQIAQDLVANGHAACVNIFPGVHSYFKWGNKVDFKDEYQLVIKTTRKRYSNVEKTILSLHPYELPEIIAVPISNGLEGYLNWIDQVTN
jgi:periplasmic divalent cation tolerance protein